MKKLLAISMSVIALSACGTRTVIVEQVQATTTTQYMAPQQTATEDLYLNNVAGMYPNLINNLGKPWLINFATTICAEVNNGMTIKDLLNMTTQYDIDAEMVGFLTGEAIRNFCPENQWFIDAALSGNI